MKLNKRIAAVCAACAVAVTLSGCAAANNANTDEKENGIAEQLPERLPEQPSEIQTPAEQEPSVGQEPSAGQSPSAESPTGQENPEKPTEQETPTEQEKPAEEPVAKPQTPSVSQPKVKTVSYIAVTADNVRIRSGAGTGYSAVGTAEKSTLYANLGKVNGWYKTNYRNKTVYISEKYCKVTEIDSSENAQIEAVIAAGAKLLGTPYVYGAVRLHDGKGNLYKGFTVTEFDCSSLTQYMFYKGADKLLQVNTRTQIYQGTTVAKSKLKRGDLIFFTNASRKNNKGIERVGHVAVYLGDNYILHTASDYAKIEQISATRQSYYIQAQRII